MSEYPAKTQAIRIVDVLLVGPLMIWGGMALQKKHPIGGGALALFGVSTIGYNAANYARVERKRRQRPT